MPMRSWTMRMPMAASIAALICALSCSKREESPPPSARPPPPRPAAAAELAAPAAPAETGLPAPDAPPAGADLEIIGQNAAAFSDLLDSLRQFAGEDVKINSITLNLKSFIQGKSDRDLMKFAEAAMQKSPFAAMQVLGYLAECSADPTIRMMAAWRFGDLASRCGDAADRARARKFYDRLVACRGDDAFVATLSAFDRSELLCAMQRLIVPLNLDEQSSFRQLAALLRDHPTSAEDLSIADWFEAMALFRSDRKDDLPEMMAFLRAIRERGVYGRLFAQREIVDHWLSQTPEEVQAEQAEFLKLRATYQPKIDARQRHLDAYPPARRLEEIQRLAEEARILRQGQDNP